MVEDWSHIPVKPGIYCIEHIASGRKYIGKSINVRRRLMIHKCDLRAEVRSKDTNRHLYGSVQKHGWSAFKTYALEVFDVVDEAVISERELYWMDFYITCDRRHGYNLRRDSSTRMIVHKETLALMRENAMGEKNPNHGNYWSDEQKAYMSRVAKENRARGIYDTDQCRAKHSAASIALWKDQDKVETMAARVSAAKSKHFIAQYTREGDLVNFWENIKDVLAEYPAYKWQNIYAVCNGGKPTYMNFLWRRVDKSEVVPTKIEAARPRDKGARKTTDEVNTYAKKVRFLKPSKSA